MEKYARQAISEGTKSADEVVVNMDAEIIRALNLHYNRNNHLEVSSRLTRVLLVCRWAWYSRCYSIYVIVSSSFPALPGASRRLGTNLDLSLFPADPGALPVRGRTDAAGVLQGDSGAEGPGAVVEEGHLQGDRAAGRTCARVLQVSDLSGAAGVAAPDSPGRAAARISARSRWHQLPQTQPRHQLPLRQHHLEDRDSVYTSD